MMAEKMKEWRAKEEVAQVAGGGRQENEEKVIMEEKTMKGGRNSWMAR